MKYPINARILSHYDNEYAVARTKDTPKVYYEPKKGVYGDKGMCESLPYYNCLQYNVC